jgi:hypothetical protein
MYKLFKGVSVMNEFISRTITDVQMLDHYVISHLSVIQNYGVVSFIVFHQ